MTTTIQDWEAQEQAMIECAQHAWASLNKGYEMLDFYMSGLHAIVGVGYPPRARTSYHHAFLFERQGWEETAQEHLRTIGKMPWHTTLMWRGLKFTNQRALVATFEPGEFCFPKAY